MLKREKTVFVLVDVQGKLARIVHESALMMEKLEQLIKGLQKLGVPIIWLEQNPDRLGSTVEELSQHLTALTPISKMSFSAWKNEEFREKLKELGRNQVLVGGIETHICVYQTCAELKEVGYEVQVVEDGVSSRTLLNKQIGLEKMKALGILPTSVEMALYELMESAEIPEFREILKVIK
ncbi:nicotinamidase-related amidase [Oikeobacillus pervagus]|uniref:Nicotinamidase-related amidase n=1 Tax=Oikeobacillus pervagus TaxID=1325931 RepID=A0AAJ1WJ28_9BACI|nr:isochorismatase family protein [Oikeobacillus pervagus]MDQ0215265.1 nicotinamidase-related amidase [Oikeobacillus pervagus]